ncbi:MAG TPA: SGNH/GDSL hydrolase family protein, partial [Thermoanaerobaculia bacterium]|nr:SGNH/GDSL hydrolase family protein [Thermoanaerobaculia bacterium]
AAGELFVRISGRYDADGTFFFRGKPVRPFALPVQRAKQLIDQYLADPTGFMQYDRDLGWTNRPGSATRDGLYRANSAGLRSDREYSKEVPEGFIRVALFGDSFIHGNDVELAGSLAPQLESALAARGIRAEALNFGVGGYGMDQAYLRYSRDGGRFDYDIVVMGLQFENIARHLMVFRLIAYPQTAIPFSKPRYYFDGPSMLVANRPTVAPEKVPETLASFHHSPLRRFETFYSDQYRRRWYLRSKLVAVLRDAIAGTQPDAAPDLGDPNGEGVRLTLRILENFRNDVTVTGKPFLLVNLPLKDNIETQAAGGADPAEPLLAVFRPGFTIVDPAPRLVALARERGAGAVAPGHYSAAGNGAVAEALAEAIERQLKE